MTWARFDDQFPDHPKVAEVGPLGGWLHVCAICYCSRMLTDGFVPKGQVRKLADIDDVTPLLTALVAAGLWEECEGGYRVHDYLEYNPAAEQVKAQRKANADRQARFRERMRESESDSVTESTNKEESNAVTNAATNGRSTSTPYPYPTNVSTAPTDATLTPEKKPKRIDQLMWDKATDAIGVTPQSDAERNKWNRGLKELRDAGVTAAEIPDLVRAYRAQFGGRITCSPNALVGRLGELRTVRAAPTMNDIPDVTDIARQRRALREAQAR